MNANSEILVAVYTLVYNHESYLRDYFEGVISQKTNFRFVAVIHDDNSQDGSVSIIKEYEKKYPDIIKPIYDHVNQWSKADGSLYRIMDEAIASTGARYIAMCEGDDYWTDPYKLQKQVDFMETHPEYIACFHNAIVRSGDNRRLFNSLYENREHTAIDIIERHWFISTQTLMYRYIPMTLSKWMGGVRNDDYLLELLLAKQGKFYYMDDVMAVYRLEGQGISVNMNSNKIKMYNDLIFLLSNMKKEYDGLYADSFDKAIHGYEKDKREYEKEVYYATHPIARAFRLKTYKRMVKKWLKRLV